jgi:hypothetical protein
VDLEVQVKIKIEPAKAGSFLFCIVPQDLTFKAKTIKTIKSSSY